MPDSDQKPTLFDPIRQKSVAADPEERVRHAVIGYLRKTLGVPGGLIVVEKMIEGAARKFRADLVIYDRNGKPWMVVECKAPDIRLSQQAFDQIGRYNRVLHAPFLLITNGHEFFCCSMDSENGKFNYLDELPMFPTES